MKKYKGLDGILLIDDDLATNFIHTKIIERASVGATVKAITNVSEALDFLTFSGAYQNTPEIPRPGLILLDINMPGLNGWDFMNAYHQLDESMKAKAVVVMVSTSLNPDDKNRALIDKEIVTFITKPIRPENLTEVVEQYFEASADAG
nr:response regulator [uncultured Mucilaginibacter sp.]